MFLLNSRLSRFTAAPIGSPREAGHLLDASLLPKLRDHYAEFLDHVSLVHLRLLASPTCVGLRYGRPDTPPKAFLARRLQRPRQGRIPSSPSALGCPTALDGHNHTPAASSFRCPSGLQHVCTGRDCSPATHRLRLWGLALGAASPGADCHGAGTLGLSVCGVLTRICAYSVRHPHLWSLHAKVPTGASPLPQRSPTPTD